MMLGMDMFCPLPSFRQFVRRYASLVRRYASSSVVTPVGPLVRYKRALLTTSARVLHSWCVLKNGLVRC